MTILPLKRLRFSPPFSRQETLQPLVGGVQPELIVIPSRIDAAAYPAGNQTNLSARNSAADRALSGLGTAVYHRAEHQRRG
jgi:hypothetical protein